MHRLLIVAASLAGALAAPSSFAQGMATGTPVRASPTQSAAGWRDDCTIMAGPMARDMYAVRCGGRDHLVPSKWIQPAGGPGPDSPATLRPPPPRAHAPTVAALSIPPGRYSCTFAASAPRLLRGFVVIGPGRYMLPDGSTGTFVHDAASGSVRFFGYLGRAVPGHWQAFYHEPGGHPTLSFRERGEEAGRCARVR